jgi:hypothetical protein
LEKWSRPASLAFLRSVSAHHNFRSVRQSDITPSIVTMLKSLALAVATVFLGLPAGLTSPGDFVTVPNGHSILLDGRVEDAEWEDAKVVLLAQGLRLLVKHDSTYLYVAVLPSEPRIFGVNLYLASGDTAASYLNLHASAKLGERTGTRTSWPEWRWWNNVGWSANVMRFNSFDGQHFLPEAAKEFQIGLARLPGPTFRLGLDLETPTGAEQPLTTALQGDGRHWYSVHLSP